MGFFSAKCRVCKHPLLSIYSMNRVNGWMVNAVLVDRMGNVRSGTYDGYGRVDGFDVMDAGCNLEDFSVFHRACWELVGKPTFVGKSRRAPDQGYFFGKEHDMANPLTTPSVAERLLKEWQRHHAYQTA